MKKIFKRFLAKLRGESEPVELNTVLTRDDVASRYLDQEIGDMSGDPPLRELRDVAGQGYVIREPPKPIGVKCGLPGCATLTLHNGGYCCAEHCREHRQMLRQKKSA